MDQGLIIEVSQSHSDTPHSVEFLSKTDRIDAETSTWQHTTFTSDGHPRTPPPPPEDEQAVLETCRGP
jgi:hypothetical protein